ncbi:MAG TPA: hypothetical protein DCF68_11285 [Cyanothece sp. UBA12306]|nr:hypothetical protein [Cyanothece sp. UBA12306]
MNNNINYTDEPMELGKIVEDFLPPPEELICKKTIIKITLELNEEKISFLKEKAAQKHISCQEIIESLIDQYISDQVYANDDINIVRN